MLAERLPRAAHVKADDLHRMIVTGAEWPSTGSRDAHRQLLLRTKNAAQLAANFVAEGVVPIIDEVIGTDAQLEVIIDVLDGTGVTFVVLTASAHTTLERDAGRGKHTAASYPDAGQLVAGVLRGRAAFIDSSELSPDETALAVQAVLPDAGWTWG